MRFLVLVKANKDSEGGVLPDEKSLAEMGEFNEQLVNAGVMKAAEGLYPSSHGVRVQFEGGKRSVRQGPFPDSNDIVAGFWIWQVRSKDEAIDWLKRAPFQEGEVELRPIMEAEALAASDPTGELRRKEEELRARIEARH